MRHLVGRPAALRHVFEADDSDTPITPGAVTATVTRAGATAPVITTTTERFGDAYHFTAYGLSQAVYTVAWSGGGYTDTETIEVVGGHLFTVGELRATDIELTAARFPRDRVIWVRDLVAAEFETITGRSFTPRTVRTEWLDPEPLPRLDVAAVKVVDAAGAEVTLRSIERIGPYTLAEIGTGLTYTVELDYGFRVAPADVKQAALLRARSLLFEDRSGIPDRATSFQPGDGGTYVLSTAGRRGATTGIPDVDAVLARYTPTIGDSVGGFW